MTLDNVKQTIADLLNLAKNDAAAQGEVDNALRFARRLMDQHRLTEDDVRKSQEPKKPVMGERPVYGYNVRHILWEMRLAQFVEKMIGSVGLYRDTNVKLVKMADQIRMTPKTCLVFYGEEEDVQLAVDLYNDLCQLVTTMAKLRIGIVVRGAGRSYCEGFVSGLYASLEKVRLEDQRSSAQTTALIVRSDAIALARKTEAKAWLTSRFGKMGKGRTMKGRSNDAASYEQGKEDGRKAQVSAKQTARKPKIDGGHPRIS